MDLPGTSHVSPERSVTHHSGPHRRRTRSVGSNSGSSCGSSCGSSRAHARAHAAMSHACQGSRKRVGFKSPLRHEASSAPHNGTGQTPRAARVGPREHDVATRLTTPFGVTSSRRRVATSVISARPARMYRRLRMRPSRGHRCRYARADVRGAAPEPSICYVAHSRRRPRSDRSRGGQQADPMSSGAGRSPSPRQPTRSFTPQELQNLGRRPECRDQPPFRTAYETPD
jgi:hypothetical protein